MAKLGSYSYPDIRFGDAVELASRISTKFKGTVSVKGLAWELGMAEGSGTLFAKVAALRDFGLIEGRGELRISQLAQRILHPSSLEEGLQARAEAFQRVELLRLLYQRFQGELPDDLGMLVGLEEITKSPREEIVRRSSLIQKHLTDATRILRRPVLVEKNQEHSGEFQNVGQQRMIPAPLPQYLLPLAEPGESPRLMVVAGQRQFSAPLTPEDIAMAVEMLSSIREELMKTEEAMEEPVGLAMAKYQDKETTIWEGEGA